MNVSLAFIRIFFTILSIFFITVYVTSFHPDTLGVIIGVLVGLGFGIVLVLLDMLFRRFNLRSFNVAILGIIFGYLMGEALVLIFDAILKISFSITLHKEIIEIIKIALFLFGIYMGMVLTLRASDELYVSIPFIKFAPVAQKKRDLIFDTSSLSDARIIDLASSGIIDNLVIIPRFVVKELYAQAELADEHVRDRARKSLDAIKKLEEMEGLGLRFNETDFPEVKDPTAKILRLARLVDSNVLTADISKVQMANIEGVKVINIHSLANSLKPIMQTGERIHIKIQRVGKEPKQGVGYLEDGTMVVVNNGGSFIGQIIEANVLSVKHTSSGRMIFCNAVIEGVESSSDEEFHE